MKIPFFVWSIVAFSFLFACGNQNTSEKRNNTDKDTVQSPPIDSLAILQQALDTVPYFITYNKKDLPQHTLEKFFLMLKDSSQSTHILYYGDSQIEGDRITTYIRDSLQKTWGGKGVGFLDFDDIASNVNVARSKSGNWQRFTFFNNTRRDGKYGIGGSTSVYSGDTAWITFNLFNHFYFDNVYLMYQNPHEEACKLVVSDARSGKKLNEISLAPNQVPQKVVLLPQANTRSFRLQFIGKSPLLMGIWADGTKQVQLNNFGMRGHAGYGLLTMNDEWLKQQAQILHTGLVVLHYGANEAPYINTEQKLANFKEGHQKLIDKIKKNMPQASILIVSVSEMGNFRTGQIHAYLPQIRDVQRELAEKNACAFWDLLGTMQDSTQTKTWRQAGLVAFDGHFTPNGHQKVGYSFANLLINAGNDYQLIDAFNKQQLPDSLLNQNKK